MTQAMTQDCIQIWQFEHAPQDLRSMHTGPGIPDWLVLIPASLRSSGFEEWLHERKAVAANRYKTDVADIVYIGWNKVGRGRVAP